MWTFVAVLGGFVVAFVALVLFAATRRPVHEQRAAQRLEAEAELLRAGVAPVGEAPWLLNRVGEDEYSLKNVGTTTLRSLQVVAVDPELEITTDGWPAALEPESTQTFQVHAERAPDRQVMVTWRADDDIRVQSWTTGLPA
jgi:hypothetical protein